jgi:acyl carrier protein
MKELENKIIEILKRYTFNDNVWESYTTKSKIIQDLKINSARIIDVTLDIEEEFNIEVDDEKLENIITVEDLIQVVSQYAIK